jgi:hypothetical protein
MTTAAQSIRDNRAREIDRQVEASNFSAPDPEIPQNANDRALAAHLQETRDQSQEYAKFRTAQAREEWEALATANFQRKQALEAGIKDRQELESQQQIQANNAEAESLILQLETLGRKFPPDWTPEWLAENMPLELRKLADLRQRINNLAAARGIPGFADGVLESGPLAPANVLGMGKQAKPPRAETFPDGSKSKVTQLEDGQIQVQLVTGEIFTGNPMTVAQQIADANVNTKLWARHKVAEAAQPQAQPAQYDQQTTAQPTEQSSIADYWADQQAQALGFSTKAEMMQWGEKMTSFQEQYENDRLATQFTVRCPDFPGDDESISKLVDIVERNGWQYTPENLEAAHTLAVRNHVYAPLSAEAIQAGNGVLPQHNRPAPPPMLRTNNPEMASSQLTEKDLWNMPSAEIRKLAMAQELNRSGPNYR